MFKFFQFVRIVCRMHLIVLICYFALVGGTAKLEMIPKNIHIVVGSTSVVHVSAWETPEVTVHWWDSDDAVLQLQSPRTVNLSAGESAPMSILGIGAGHAIVSANTSSRNISTVDAFVRCTIMHSYAAFVISQAVGWVYFVAWSISFYPQIYENWRRKSVVGLNFDYLALNLCGFALYSLFNCGLYWIPKIKDLYFERHPKSHNPVMINDIVFSLHACFATAITIIQCFLYERENQSVSLVARIMLGVMAVFLEISFFLAGISVISWLDFLYYCSYVKLVITLVKYVPQAFMNYRRKSTIGWSIGNILLDFTGGTLSMLQMILNSYNYDDWESIFGDPTKFGLGLFSVIFDVFFMIQHYVLYKEARDTALNTESITESNNVSNDATEEEEEEEEEAEGEERRGDGGES